LLESRFLFLLFLQMMRFFDTDGNGEVDATEFHDTLADLIHTRKKEKVSEFISAVEVQSTYELSLFNVFTPFLAFLFVVVTLHFPDPGSRPRSVFFTSQARSWR
jgi:hypothetical protein